MKRLFWVALMVLVSMIGMVAVSPVTAGADDRDIREVLKVLNTIVANQQRLLNQINDLQKTTPQTMNMYSARSKIWKKPSSKTGKASLTGWTQYRILPSQTRHASSTTS